MSLEFVRSNHLRVYGICYPLSQETDLEWRAFVVANSNSDWTFIALNLPIQEDSKAQQNHKNSQPKSVSRDRRGVKHHEECQGMIQVKVGMLWCTGRFKLLSKRGQEGRDTISSGRAFHTVGASKARLLFDRIMIL